MPYGNRKMKPQQFFVLLLVSLYLISSNGRVPFQSIILIRGGSSFTSNAGNLRILARVSDENPETRPFEKISRILLSAYENFMLSFSNNRLKKAEENVTFLTEELQIVQQSYQETLESLSNISQELQSARIQHFELQQESLSAQSHAQLAQEQLRQALDRLNALETQSSLKFKHQEHRIDSLVKLSHELEVDVSRATNATELLSRNIETRDIEIQMLQSRIEELRAALESREAQFVLVTDQLMEKERHISTLEDLVSEAKKVALAELNSNQSLSEELSMVKASLGDLSAEYSSFKIASKSKTEQLSDDIKMYKKELNGAQSRLKEYEAESNKAQQGRQARLDASIDQIQQLQESYNERQASAEHELQPPTLLESSSSVEQEVVDTLRSECKSRIQEISEYKQQLGHLQSQLDCVSGEFKSFKSSSALIEADLHREIELRQSKLEAAESSLWLCNAESIQAQQGLKGDLEVASSQIQDLLASLRYQEQVVEELTSQLASKNDEISYLTMALESSRGQE